MPYLKSFSLKVFFISLIVAGGIGSPVSAHPPYTIHIRSSFSKFVKVLLQDQSHLSLHTYSAPLLLLTAQQAGTDRGPHLIVGFEAEKKDLIKKGVFHPYVKGELALIVPGSDNKVLKEWMATKGEVVGQDPKSSSTGKAFEKWAIKQGYTLAHLSSFFYRRCATLASSFLLFTQGQGKAMIGYLSTPTFANGDPAKQTLKALPLPGAAEVWGIVITERGLKDPRTPAIIRMLFSPRAKTLIQEVLLLSPF